MRLNFKCSEEALSIFICMKERLAPHIIKVFCPLDLYLILSMYSTYLCMARLLSVAYRVVPHKLHSGWRGGKEGDM